MRNSLVSFAYKDPRLSTIDGHIQVVPNAIDSCHDRMMSIPQVALISKDIPQRIIDQMKICGSINLVCRTSSLGSLINVITRNRIDILIIHGFKQLETARILQSHKKLMNETIVINIADIKNTTALIESTTAKWRHKKWKIDASF